jgi:hypothetical protein
MRRVPDPTGRDIALRITRAFGDTMGTHAISTKPVVMHPVHLRIEYPPFTLG